MRDAVPRCKEKDLAAATHDSQHVTGNTDDPPDQSARAHWILAPQVIW
jgi:hypothetical protein